MYIVKQWKTQAHSNTAQTSYSVCLTEYCCRSDSRSKY